MLELFLGVIEPPKTPLIDYVTETQQTETVPIPEIQEIKDPNNCEPAMYWAKEAPYYCIPKPTQRRSDSTFQASSTRTPVSAKTSTASSGWYEWGWCTYYVSTQRQVGQWNNARDWPRQARNDGYTVSTTPIVGAIAQKGNHVAIVRAVENGQITIQEMNYEGFGVISSRTISPTGWQFIY